MQVYSAEIRRQNYVGLKNHDQSIITKLRFYDVALVVKLYLYFNIADQTLHMMFCSKKSGTFSKTEAATLLVVLGSGARCDVATRSPVGGRLA